MNKIAILAMVLMVVPVACRVPGWSKPDGSDVGQLQETVENADPAVSGSLAYTARGRDVCAKLLKKLDDTNAFALPQGLAPAFTCRMPAEDPSAPWYEKSSTIGREETAKICAEWGGRGSLMKHIVEAYTRRWSSLMGAGYVCEFTKYFSSWPYWVDAVKEVSNDNPDPEWTQEEEQRQRVLFAEAVVAGLMGGWLLIPEVTAVIPEADSVLKAIGNSAFCPQATGNGECDPQSPYYVPSPSGGAGDYGP